MKVHDSGPNKGFLLFVQRPPKNPEELPYEIVRYPLRVVVYASSEREALRFFVEDFGMLGSVTIRLMADNE